MKVDIYDPIVNKDLVESKYNLRLIDNKIDIDWLSTHKFFAPWLVMNFKNWKLMSPSSALIYDIKSILKS